MSIISYWTPDDNSFNSKVRGRLLVVEYKGKQLSHEESRDSREKEFIGQQWAKASVGKAVFVMAAMERGDPTEVRAQVLAALGPERGTEPDG